MTRIFLACSLLMLSAIGGRVFAQHESARSDSIAVTMAVDVPITQTTPDRLISFPDLRRGLTSMVSPVSGGDAAAHVVFVGDAAEPVVLSSSSTDMVKFGTGPGTGLSAVRMKDKWIEVMSWSSGASNRAVSITCNPGYCTAAFSPDDLDGDAIDGLGSIDIWIGGECSASIEDKHGLYQGSVVVFISMLN